MTWLIGSAIVFVISIAVIAILAIKNRFDWQELTFFGFLFTAVASALSWLTISAAVISGLTYLIYKNYEKPTN